MKLVHVPMIDEERIAAYIDGTLSPEEMSAFNNDMAHDDALAAFVSDFKTDLDIVDNGITLEQYEPNFDPIGAVDSLFANIGSTKIPSVENMCCADLVTLTPEPVNDNLMVATCAMEEPVDDVKSIIDESHDGRYNPFGHPSDLDNHNSMLNHDDNRDGVEGDGFSHIGEDI